MKCFFVSAAAVITLSVCYPAMAQSISVCGDPPPVANETLKGEIKGKAQLLSKYVGGAELSGRIETSRSEIFSKYPDAEQSRSNAYFEYQVCVLIMSDSAKSTSQKLDALKDVRREFNKPIIKKHNIIIQSGSALYDNRQFGHVQGSLSTVVLKIDGNIVTKHELDKPFGSHKVELVEGDHTFEFIADIEGMGLLGLKDNCQGNFSVSRPGTFEPRLRFRAVSDLDGKITSCSLSEK